MRSGDEGGCRTNLRVLRFANARPRARRREPPQGSRVLAKKTQDYRHPAEYYTNPENSIGYLARVVFRSFSRLLERRTLTHDVSAGQWRFLRQLWREDGITQRELSERVGMREPTTVVALKGLEKAGFITRTKTAEERRQTFI